jgi:acetyltransferase-like isoleucine patch superfamily enzyme
MKKSLIRRVYNRFFHILARFSPGATTLRPMLHRARGVKIGANVFIGDDVFIDNEYPECIEVGDNAQISIRVVIVAHTRGPGRVIVGRDAFIGPHCVIACSSGRTLTIGAGAVIGPGCVITRNVAPRVYLVLPPLRPAGIATVSLPSATSMEEFVAGLRPWTEDIVASGE